MHICIYAYFTSIHMHVNILVHLCICMGSFKHADSTTDKIPHCLQPLTKSLIVFNVQNYIRSGL